MEQHWPRPRAIGEVRVPLLPLLDQQPRTRRVELKGVDGASVGGERADGSPRPTLSFVVQVLPPLP